MRTITRTGVTLSVVAALALYGLQLIAGLVVTLGIIAVGALAGLAVAKWLERDWYGRQLDAGARAGAIACGVAGLSSAIYLLGQRPGSIAALAARSHLLGLSLAPLVKALSPLGVAGVDVVAVIVAALLGVAVAALTAQIFGWGKDKRSQRVIAQARLAAQAQQQDEIGAPSAVGIGGLASPSAQLLGRPTAGSNAHPRTNGPRVRRTAGPEPGAEVADAAPTFDSWGDTAATLPVPPPTPRHTSHARSADHAITADERAALLAWEASLAEESEPGATTREPKKSAFLNAPMPSPRRNRKKQNTRDWLC